MPLRSTDTYTRAASGDTAPGTADPAAAAPPDDARAAAPADQVVAAAAEPPPGAASARKTKGSAAKPSRPARDPLPGLLAIGQLLRGRADAAFERFGAEWSGESSGDFFREVGLVAARIADAARAGVEIERKYLLRFLPESMRAKLSKLVVVDAVALAEQVGRSPWMFVRDLGQLAYDRMSTEGASERSEVGIGIAAPLIGATQVEPTWFGLGDRDRSRTRVGLHDARLTEVRRELRSVQAELRRDIDRLDGWLKFFNIAAVPLLIGFGGIAVGLSRRRRQAPGSERKG